MPLTTLAPMAPWCWVPLGCFTKRSCSTLGRHACGSPLPIVHRVPLQEVRHRPLPWRRRRPLPRCTYHRPLRPCPPTGAVPPPLRRRRRRGQCRRPRAGSRRRAFGAATRARWPSCLSLCKGQTTTRSPAPCRREALHTAEWTAASLVPRQRRASSPPSGSAPRPAAARCWASPATATCASATRSWTTPSGAWAAALATAEAARRRPRTRSISPTDRKTPSTSKSDWGASM
mmetsp:Transcript_16612/g.42917  ORF Transcript_16612/g.42917 Transcript_16612/m.42917 type:complete len:231 (-) Transcript_16612:82-774(-)